jgi:hypothetical protein
MTAETKDTLLSILKDYGFATVLACALLWVGRQDIILPMVESHREFLRDVADTQKEISQAISEQTRLLYALQPKDVQVRTVDSKEPEGGKN